MLNNIERENQNIELLFIKLLYFDSMVTYARKTIITKLINNPTKIIEL
jgi:hypothetical protein